MYAIWQKTSIGEPMLVAIVDEPEPDVVATVDAMNQKLYNQRLQFYKKQSKNHWNIEAREVYLERFKILKRDGIYAKHEGRLELIDNLYIYKEISISKISKSNRTTRLMEPD